MYKRVTQIRQKMKPLLLILVFLASYPSSAANVNNQDFYNWLVNEHTKNPELNTNQLMWSDQFQNFLINNMTNREPIYLGMTASDELKDLKYHMLQALSGPPDTVKVNENSSILISGCRFRSCDEKGFIWIDPINANQIFVVISYFFRNKKYRQDGYVVIYSDKFKTTSEMPENFKESLASWLHLHDFTSPQTEVIQ